MKSILEQWGGNIEVDDGSFKDFNPEDGETFHVRLVPKTKDDEIHTAVD